MSYILKGILVLTICGFSASLFANENNQSIQRLAQEALNELWQLNRRNVDEKKMILKDKLDRISKLSESSSGHGVESIVSNEHYLVAADCTHSLVGAGSRVMVLDPKVYSVGAYTKALKVRILSNTYTGSIGATIGCVGYALQYYVVGH